MQIYQQEITFGGFLDTPKPVKPCTQTPKSLMYLNMYPSPMSSISKCMASRGDVTIFNIIGPLALGLVGTYFKNKFFLALEKV